MNIIKRLLMGKECSSCMSESRNPVGEETERKSPRLDCTGERRIPTEDFDRGNRAEVIDLGDKVYLNDYYRRALWTGEHLQLLLMSIPVGEEIGTERHNGTDQMIFIKRGMAEVSFGRSHEDLKPYNTASDSDVITVPSGTLHRIRNVGRTPLKLYTVYGPAHHPYGTEEKHGKE